MSFTTDITRVRNPVKQSTAAANRVWKDSTTLSAGNGGTKGSINALRGCVMSNEFDMESEWITELGKARSDEYTEKILAFVQELEKSAPEPFLPLLTDLALARTLIVHLVIRYGPERGMAEARDAFESTLEQMKPLLERMKSRKGPPPQ